MIALRPAESDADLDAWRRVRMAVLPEERTQTAGELRSSSSPSALCLLAELDGRCTVLAWAGEHGLRELYTWTQNGNAAMRAVDESLGYETRSVGIRLRGRLPPPR